MTARPILRRLDWRPRLTAYLGAVRSVSFGYGEGQLDCALFAAGAVEAMTGVDLADGWRGYRSGADGVRRLRDRGFDGMPGLLAHHCAACPPLLARPGDLVLLPRGAVGVCQGRLAYAMGRDGVKLADMADATKGYRVPTAEDAATEADDGGAPCPS